MGYNPLMRIVQLGLISVTLLASQLPLAHAAPQVLQNDSFVSGMAAGFQGGFVPSEIGAVRLDPPPGGPYQVTEVTLLFGGSTATRDVTLKIWNDSGDTNPGGMIYEGEFTLTGANDAFSSIDLSGSNVYVAGPFRVGIEFAHSGYPSIARDSDNTIRQTHNFILTDMFGWFQSSALGLTGDWVIRATIDVPMNPMVDAGMPVPDASVPDPDASVPTPDASVPTPDAGVPDPDAGTSGQSCMVHSECPTGQYCTEDDMCTYDCRVDFDCGNDMRCTSLGMCEPVPSQGGCRAGGNSTPWSAGLLFVLMFGLSWAGSQRRRRRS